MYEYVKFCSSIGPFTFGIRIFCIFHTKFFNISKVSKTNIYKFKNMCKLFQVQGYKLKVSRIPGIC